LASIDFAIDRLSWDEAEEVYRELEEIKMDLFRII